MKTELTKQEFYILKILLYYVFYEFMLDYDKKFSIKSRKFHLDLGANK